MVGSITRLVESSGCARYWIRGRLSPDRMGRTKRPHAESGLGSDVYAARAMPFCTSCGNQVQDEDTYCRVCGERQRVESRRSGADEERLDASPRSGTASRQLRRAPIASGAETHDGHVHHDEFPSATFGQRFRAYIIDIGALAGISFILGYWLTLSGVRLESGPASAISILIPALYFAMGDGFGQTLGKRMLRIEVVTGDLGPPGFGRGILRFLGRIVSGAPLGLGYLWMLWDASSQSWHDKIARTYVVQTKRRGTTSPRPTKAGPH